ncbi:MAG: ATP-grasp domain-containing protein [Chloroflexota bacterium]|nr:ATP-grasp domain-containing protein [bacterium]MDE2767958.1 ATP-grasp domain-containing protein [Chloroflexota bacterium]MDE2897607.1 ATP-grasp domain-containing protein [Chloroflexota bacterium]
MAHVVLLLHSESYRAADFLQAARQLGVDITVASDRRNPAASDDDRVLEVHLANPQVAASAIIEYAGETAVDAVVAVDDQGVATAALASEQLGLTHNPPSAISATRNKADMRQRLKSAGVRQPAFEVVTADSDSRIAAERVGFPLVVKPVSLSASQGVIRVDRAGDLPATIERTRSIAQAQGRDQREPILVERFIPGAEVAVEGLMRCGSLEVLAIFDKPDPLDGPFFEETIYVTPSRLTPATQKSIRAVTASGAKALGLSEGPIHAELRTGDGNAWLLEIAARSIGGLCARSLRFGLGLSLEQLILRHALELPIRDLGLTDAAAGVMMLPIPQAGRLRAVRGVGRARAVDGVAGVEITISPGQELVPLPEGSRYLGFIFARGQDPDDVEATLRAAHAELTFEITPL